MQFKSRLFSAQTAFTSCPTRTLTSWRGSMNGDEMIQSIIIICNRRRSQTPNFTFLSISPPKSQFLFSNFQNSQFHNWITSSFFSVFIYFRSRIKIFFRGQSGSRKRSQRVSSDTSSTLRYVHNAIILKWEWMCLMLVMNRITCAASAIWARDGDAEGNCVYWWLLCLYSVRTVVAVGRPYWGWIERYDDANRRKNERAMHGETDEKKKCFGWTRTACRRNGKWILRRNSRRVSVQ